MDDINDMVNWDFITIKISKKRDYHLFCAHCFIYKER